MPNLNPRVNRLSKALLLSLCVLGGLLGATTAFGQDVGTVRGRVTRADRGTPLGGVIVAVKDIGISCVTNANGDYELPRVPVGTRAIIVEWSGYRLHEVAVNVTATGSANVDAALDPNPILLSEIIVHGASRAPERVVEAPSAVAVVEVADARDLSITGQAPRALAKLPGADVVQSGVNDYNVNTRGFNSLLNRRILVLQDGRDLAIPLLGSQEWSAMTTPLEDMARIEMVRGPGSALYGANAYNGVVSFTTWAAREAVGTKVTLGGGELNTMRGDMMHAGVSRDGRLGYKVNVGYLRSDTWTVSRTTRDSLDLFREYQGISDVPAAKSVEVFPLFGQDMDNATGAPSGASDPVTNLYGTARLDYYRDDGSVVSVEGGSSLSENGVLVTGIGRIQIDKAVKPWVRFAWAANSFNVMAWYSGRSMPTPARSLSSGINIEDKSGILHGEGQFNRRFLNGRAHVVIGASARSAWIDTKSTLISPQLDARRDWYYSGYGQVEYEASPQIRIVGAVRYDNGSLYQGQLSPKGAVVFSPSDQHAVRLTVNRAFQTPSHTDFFLRAPAAAPANFSQLEAGLRASPLGPALGGVPNGSLFTTSAAVPVLALGNDSLDVETITSFEVGYKGQMTEGVFLAIDGYYSQLRDFVTDLLPMVNPAFAPWTAPTAVPEAVRPTLEETVRGQLVGAGQNLAAAGLTRLADGSTAIALSYGNAGEVEEYGVEVGIGIMLVNEIRFDGNYAFFDYDVNQESVAQGDVLLPNSPKHRGRFGVSYAGRQGLDVGLDLLLTDSYDWAAGVFHGRIPSSERIDVTAGYLINNHLRVFGVATNIFDQRSYQVYGGSVIGRRILGGVTATF